MKKVAVLTDFYVADPSYSICIVIEEQLGMLLRAGYKPVAIVEENFKPVRVWKYVELRNVIPTGIKRDNVVRFYEGWEHSAQLLYEAFHRGLSDVDVILTHDLIYQCSQIWHNYAARAFAAKNPNKTWLHWVHSVTPSEIWRRRDKRLEPLQKYMPRSKLVVFNDYDIKRVAVSYGHEVNHVVVVPHPTDFCGFMGFHEITTKLVYQKRMLDADAIFVYPIRLDRGKQVEYVLRTAAAVKQRGKEVRVVIADFHSTGGDKVKYRDDLKFLAQELFLDQEEVTFMSEFDEQTRVSSPRQVIRDLFLLSNVYVHSSKSETYSLTTQEALLCGNVPILNFDFPPMRSVYGKHAGYFKFSSNIDVMTGTDGETNTDYDNIDAYFGDIASYVCYMLENDPVINQMTRIRKTRNPDHVFKQFIEPLFAAFDGGTSW